MIGVKRKNTLNQKTNENFQAPSALSAEFIVCPPSIENCFKSYNEEVQKVRIMVLQKVLNLVEENMSAIKEENATLFGL